MARYLGVDIGDHAIRGVLIRSALRKVEIERYVEIPLSQPPDSPARAPELAEAGRNLLAALPATPDTVIGSVPGDHVSLRTVTLPAAVKKRIDDVLPFELEAVLPYSPSDAIVDHQPIGTHGSEMQLLVASALRHHVEHTIEDMRAASLDPRELAAGAAALDGLVNVMPELKTTQPLLLLHVGDRHTEFCLMVDGRCVHARTLDVGIEDLPDHADDLERGLRRTLAATRVEGLDTPARVLLSGPGAMASGSREWLASKLEQEVEVLRPPAPESGQGSAAFGKAAALAARGVLGGHHINLRSGDLAPTDMGADLSSHINLFVTCAVLVVMAVMFSLKAQQSLLLDEQDALRDQLAETSKGVLGRTIDDPALVEKAIEDPKGRDPLPGFDAFDVLEAISSSIDTDISHDVRRLRVEVADEKHEGLFEMQGSLESLGQRDQVVARLESHACFDEIERGRTTPARGESRINYTIEAKVQCPADKGKKKSGGN
ncbi:MAG: pilus assembly protein PilM [Myxococcales bacterium]|jgi:general secretion pathway protein L